MDSLSALLKKYNLYPRKGLGQNFLVDPHHLAKIVDIAELTPHDTVLEIGPGPGTLTRLLVQAAGQVIAVEVDPGMVNLLKHELPVPNLSLIQADILQTQLSIINEQYHKGTMLTIINEPLPIPQGYNVTNYQLPTLSYKVVANLPYYITSAVLRHVLAATPRPQRVVVTVQKEVAQRMVAQPGQMSLLAVSVQLYGQAKLVHHIPAGAFYPAPKVDSAVVRLDTYPDLAVAVANVDHFFQVVKAGFGQKRKQLKNSLVAGLHKSAGEVGQALQQAHIDPTRRAETLSLTEWATLAEIIKPG